jgi:hypothetical protein
MQCHITKPNDYVCIGNTSKCNINYNSFDLLWGSECLNQTNCRYLCLQFVLQDFLLSWCLPVLVQGFNLLQYYCFYSMSNVNITLLRRTYTVRYRWRHALLYWTPIIIIKVTSSYYGHDIKQICFRFSHSFIRLLMIKLNFENLQPMAFPVKTVWQDV